MAGIYIHIPFCKQACHYCDFHFSTSLAKKDQLLPLLHRELELRRSELPHTVETIYFGGGTPSLLDEHEVSSLIATIYKLYDVVPHPEITLEANPDDLSVDYIQALARTPINRLSIGVQSFRESDLKLMNRAHNAQMAVDSIRAASLVFPNYSIDLIYGIPGLDDAQWKENLNIAIELGAPHISSYALTVEDNTALKTFIEKELIPPVLDEDAQRQFHILVDRMETEGYENYEFSNFGKPGFLSRNNTGYWTGKPYLGIGPSAHSYDGETRSWNKASNPIYIKSLTRNELPIERETLSVTDRYNEHIMTGLRTKWGVHLPEVGNKYGEVYQAYLFDQAGEYLESGLLELRGETLHVTRKGKFLSDGLAADLFMLNLQS